MEIEDTLLILRFNRGDKVALHRIYEKYKDRLVTLAGALLRDASSAQDVVHDVFHGFMQQAGLFRLTGSLPGYLSTCVANHARNCNRSRRSRQEACSGESALGAREPIQQMMMDEEVRRIAQALSKLPDEQREVVALRIFADQRFPAIARLQGVSVNTAEGRFRYAAKKLRELLDEEVL